MTTIKRLHVKSQEEADRHVHRLRRAGRSAWCEADGPQHYLCVRVEVVCIRADNCIRPHLFN